MSISVDANADRHDLPGGGVMVVGDASSGVSTVVIRPPAVSPSMDTCPPSGAAGTGGTWCAVPTGEGQQTGTEPAVDALADVLLGGPTGVDHDVEVVLGDRLRLEQDRRHLGAPGGREGRRALHRGDVRVGAQRDGCFTGGLAEHPGVLPHRHHLRAERNAVECGLVAVLPRDRDLAGQALGLERGHHAAGHAVVLGQHRVDLVVGRGEDLLHVGLRVRRFPVVGVRPRRRS